MRDRKTAPETDIMTVREVADYLDCHYMTIYRLVKTAGLPAFRLGGNWRFRRSEIETWIKEQSVVSENEPQSEPRPRKRTQAPAKRPPKPKPKRVRRA
jgi:excisionase family DNA binding protein